MSAKKSGPQKVVLEGRGGLVLRASDYIASGGEGVVYRSGNTVVKLYSDPEKMHRDGMSAKIRQLAALRHDYIVAPAGIVSDQAGDPIGYFMPFAEGEPLARVFTNDFRQRMNFSDKAAATLVERMRDAVLYAHSVGAVLVDGNEFNWLASLDPHKGPLPRAIDVDSWAIGRWPAKVIMPSIRDWHTTNFSSLTDWFAWAIVTFQVFAGIHPYKGTLAGFDRSDMEGRMKANRSVFAPGVRLNRAVRDFAHIPAPLLSWYEATFERGERSLPPSPFASGTALPSAAKILRVVTRASGALVYEKLFGVTNNPALRIFPCGVVLCADGALVDLGTGRYLGVTGNSDCEVVETESGWLVGRILGGSLLCEHVDRGTQAVTTTVVPLNAQRLVRSANRLFGVTDRGLVELVHPRSGKFPVTIGQTWGALPLSTSWWSGVGVQDALGARFLVIPFGERACTFVRTPELDGLHVVSAKAGPRYVALIVASQKGTYERFEFTFDQEHRTYTLLRSAADGPELNMAILPKGVAASIVDDGELLILVPTSGKVVTVTDKAVTTDMLLGAWGDRVLYVHEGQVWSVRMK